MRRALGLGLLVFLGAPSAEAQRFAQPPPARGAPALQPLPPPVASDATDLRKRFGVDMAKRLLESADLDAKLRGLERAASTGTPEAVSLLVHALSDSSGAARGDTRAMLTAVRGLAPFTSSADVVKALTDHVINAPPGSSRSAARGPSEPEPVDRDHAARIELVRQTAALALASSGDAKAIERLLEIARGGGAGQPYAILALEAFPPSQLATAGPLGVLTPPSLRLAAHLGDLRAIDSVGLAERAPDPLTRAAALVALAELGDSRAIDLARRATKDSEPRVREAGAVAMVLLDAPDRMRAVEALLSDDTTALAGARLAARASDLGVVKALAARAVASSDGALRTAVVTALGRASSADAVRVLAALVKDPLLEGEAAQALVRSPSAEAEVAMDALLAAPARSPARRLGVRIYVARARVRGLTQASALSTLFSMAKGTDVPDRAVAVGALVALGEMSVKDALADGEARVRRAAAMASLAQQQKETGEALKSRLGVETDAATREVLAIGLLDGDAAARLTTLSLLDRAQAGGSDAPLSAMALARRADATEREHVNALLASRDPLLRAHTALGLGASDERDATGRLAGAYTYEPNPSVRRALVLALAARGMDKFAPERAATLGIAARLDPDRGVRLSATRAIAGLPSAPAPPHVAEMAWVRLATADGRPPAANMTGTLVRSDGMAVPVAFDDDGYAVVPVPPGEVRLLLAPHPPEYDSRAHDQ
jgi:HEAT repeat protein